MLHVHFQREMINFEVKVKFASIYDPVKHYSSKANKQHTLFANVVLEGGNDGTKRVVSRKSLVGERLRFENRRTPTPSLESGWRMVSL